MVVVVVVVVVVRSKNMVQFSSAEQKQVLGSSCSSDGFSANVREPLVSRYMIFSLRECEMMLFLFLHFLPASVLSTAFPLL
jgi:hypothetical protein